MAKRKDEQHNTASAAESVEDSVPDTREKRRAGIEKIVSILQPRGFMGFGLRSQRPRPKPKLQSALDALAFFASNGVRVKDEHRKTLLGKVETWCDENGRPRPKERTLKAALKEFKGRLRSP